MRRSCRYRACGLGRAAIACAFLFLWGSLRSSLACTIFVLTDSQHALFCNNEDYSNPNTRIWFVPSEGHYGCVYVGFDNGWAQGGMNSAGLAFDWVAGFQEKWEPGAEMQPVSGNPAQRMLETCATVEQATAFFQTHREPSFSYAKILVADRTGASVIIGAKDGHLQFEKQNQSRGFGYGAQTLERMLADAPEPSPANGARILKACLQKGQYATKYSNLFDLKNGDIFLYPVPSQHEPVMFNLASELAKGGHYLDQPRLHEELTQPLKPLLEAMTSSTLDRFRPIPDKEPEVTARVRALLAAAAEGKLRPDDFAAKLWSEEVAPRQEQTRRDLSGFGTLLAVRLVDRTDENGKRSYRYRLEFQKVTLLQHYVFDQQNKIELCTVEAVE